LLGFDNTPKLAWDSEDSPQGSELGTHSSPIDECTQMTGIHFQSEGLLVSKPKRKVFDPIHNFIGFDNFIWKMIDTPVFQRLRHLKQLGFCDQVWPGARHARFEHSLGVGHLAEKFILKAFENSDYKETNLGKEDKRFYTNSVLMAGLFHDLGHGPFSHGFEGVIHRLGKQFPFTLKNKYIRPNLNLVP
jgi:HD superfamily phosphohydrolase